MCWSATRAAIHVAAALDMQEPALPCGRTGEVGPKIGRHAELLKKQKFSLQANSKTREGSDPDRDAQFRVFDRPWKRPSARTSRSLPLNTKKKVLAGDFSSELALVMASPRRSGRGAWHRLSDQGTRPRRALWNL